MIRIHFYELLLLVAGAGLVWLSYYIPASYIYRQVCWVETEALLTGLRLDDARPTMVNYYQLEYTDAEGLLHRIEVDDENTITTGRDEDHVRLYYDPENPDDYELVNAGRYLLILFLPFGLLCLYLGWPRWRE